MSNLNGQIILNAMHQINKPATLKKIVLYIAAAEGMLPMDIRDTVEEGLQGGYQYGFIQRANGKYFTSPVDPDELELDDDELSEGEEDDSMDIEDPASLSSVSQSEEPQEPNDPE